MSSPAAETKLTGGEAGPLDAGMRLPANLLLFGADFSLQRKASELTYWRDLVVHLAPYVEEVVVVSVNNRQTAVERLGGNLHVYNIAPVLPRAFRRHHPDPDFCGRGFHALPLSLFFKTETLRRNLPFLDDIIARHRIGVVHFMRVFGLLNRSLVQRHPKIAYAITVPTYIDRGYPAHLAYHVVRNSVFNAFDRIVTTNEATRRRLVGLGFAADKMAVVPWSTDDAAPRHVQRAGKPFVLWAGPLQDTGDAEFLFAVDVARKATLYGNPVTFRFAFKPNKLREWHRQSVRGLDNVVLTETSRDAFACLQDEAALFLSPVCNRHRTVAPPLTWLEMMGRGVPVVTTPVEGVEEVVTHEHDGLVCASPTAMAGALNALTPTRVAAMGMAASKTVASRFDMRQIARAHVALWAGIVAEKGAMPLHRVPA